MPVTMQLKIPDLAVVALVGATGSGKTTFARQHFKPTEILSSDHCRGLVSDDDNDQRASDDAFDLLYTIARKRLARRLLTVVDATNVQADSRRHVLALAREYHAIPVAIVLDVGAKLCLERTRNRFETAIEDCVAKGDLTHVKSPRAVASHLTNTLNGLGVLRGGGATDEELDEVVDVALSVLE